MSTTRTQADALDALTAAGVRIERAAERYATGGEAVKAQAARTIAAAYTDRAAIYRQLPKLYSGRRPARWLAVIGSADAALAMELLGEEWRMRADRHDAEAARIERQALPAFALTRAPSAVGSALENGPTLNRWRVLSGGLEDGPRGPQAGARR